jgi:hypothetical protein
VGTITYTIQVSLNGSFTNIVAQASVSEDASQTSLTLNKTLQFDKLYYWRVRAADPDNTGPWSRTRTFRTPSSGGGGGTPPPPPPPGGGSGSCASKDGSYIARCVSAKYPDRIRPTSTLDQRKANMMFLRDRMIESAICGGMDAGWNLKRGGPELSIDYMVYRRNGLNYGVDIAYDYDNFRNTLRLHWLEDGPTAHYKAYSPRPSCN